MRVILCFFRVDKVFFIRNCRVNLIGLFFFFLLFLSSEIVLFRFLRFFLYWFSLWWVRVMRWWYILIFKVNFFVVLKMLRVCFFSFMKVFGFLFFVLYFWFSFKEIMVIWGFFGFVIDDNFLSIFWMFFMFICFVVGF